ncbi:phage tail protein [cf. Phormidesmis sp. LEGE 11477]|uniref:phage tail protein n=1 Tax=cf. Phormidesmis sp. LEGE 11477 TaxID=1828680 RepID=UPI001882EBE4|nr:phage tail protein [cf. Phormidesmis sp. LEGE 11477]MBE9062416.1 phage tail protein [cf. Phormidesmis sp. LEGE 11477]
MAAGELLTGARFYLEIDGMTDLIVKKVSGLQITLEAAGDSKSFGVTKGGKSRMQATVAGVTSGTLSVDFVATVQDTSLHDWFRESHPAGGPMAGGVSTSGGERKTGSITAYNQGGDDAARWEFTGFFPKSYKTSKMEPGGTELFTETVEVVYETCHRTK